MNVAELEEAVEKEPLLLREWAEEALAHGASTTKEQVRWILENRDMADLNELCWYALLAAWVREHGPQRANSRAAFGGRWVPLEDQDGRVEAGYRVLMTPAIWTVSWNVGGVEVMTEDLTQQHVAVLRDTYSQKTVELLARVQWLDAVQALLREHKCKTVGGLRKKNVALPEITLTETDL